MFIVQPVTRWILTPGRYSHRKGILYAIGFLGLISSYQLWADKIKDAQPNLYQILDIPVSATPQEIKKAFRKLSLEHHPDKAQAKASTTVV